MMIIFALIFLWVAIVATITALGGQDPFAPWDGEQ